MRRLLLAIVLGPVLLAAGPATAAQAYDVDDLRAKLSREMALAGASSGALVRDLDSGATLYERRADERRVPASVEKLFTTSRCCASARAARWPPASSPTARWAPTASCAGTSTSWAAATPR